MTWLTSAFCLVFRGLWGCDCGFALPTFGVVPQSSCQFLASYTRGVTPFLEKIIFFLYCISKRGEVYSSRCFLSLGSVTGNAMVEWYSGATHLLSEAIIYSFCMVLPSLVEAGLVVWCSTILLVRFFEMIDEP